MRFQRRATWARLPAAHCARVLPDSVPLQGGSRECRVFVAPAALRASEEKHASKSPQVRRNIPAFPAQWFTTYSALLVYRALLPPSPRDTSVSRPRADIAISQSLTP